jgi:hypothetical protein
VELDTHNHIGGVAARGWWVHDRIAQLYDVVEEEDKTEMVFKLFGPGSFCSQRRKIFKLCLASKAFWTTYRSSRKVRYYGIFSQLFLNLITWENAAMM